MSDFQPINIQKPIVGIWVEADKQNDAAVLIRSIQKYTPKADIFVYHVEGAVSKVYESVKRVVEVTDTHPLIAATDDLRRFTKVILLRATSLVQEDITEMMNAPLNDNQLIAAVRATRSWSDSNKRALIEHLDKEVFDISMAKDHGKPSEDSTGAFRVCGMVVDCKQIVARAISVGHDSLASYAELCSDNLGSLMAFFNHMSPSNIGIPDNFFSTAEYVAKTLISPAEQALNRDRIGHGKVISYFDPEFQWGDVNIYKSVYLQLPTQPYMAAVEEFKADLDEEFVERVKLTHEACKLYNIVVTPKPMEEGKD